MIDPSLASLCALMNSLCPEIQAGDPQGFEVKRGVYQICNENRQPPFFLRKSSLKTSAEYILEQFHIKTNIIKTNLSSIDRYIKRLEERPLRAVGTRELKKIEAKIDSITSISFLYRKLPKGNEKLRHRLAWIGLSNSKIEQLYSDLKTIETVKKKLNTLSPGKELILYSCKTFPQKELTKEEWSNITKRNPNGSKIEKFKHLKRIIEVGVNPKLTEQVKGISPRNLKTILYRPIAELNDEAWQARVALHSLAIDRFSQDPKLKAYSRYLWIMQLMDKNIKRQQHRVYADYSIRNLGIGNRKIKHYDSSLEKTLRSLDLIARDKEQVSIDYAKEINTILPLLPLLKETTETLGADLKDVGYFRMNKLLCFNSYHNFNISKWNYFIPYATTDVSKAWKYICKKLSGYLDFKNICLLDTYKYSLKKQKISHSYALSKAYENCNENNLKSIQDAYEPNWSAIFKFLDQLIKWQEVKENQELLQLLKIAYANKWLLPKDSRSSRLMAYYLSKADKTSTKNASVIGNFLKEYIHCYFPEKSMEKIREYIHLGKTPSVKDGFVTWEKQVHPVDNNIIKKHRFALNALLLEEGLDAYKTRLLNNFQLQLPC